MLTTVALKRRAYRVGLARSLQLRNRRRARRLAVAAGAVPLFRRGTGMLTDYQSLMAGDDLASETNPSRVECRILSACQGEVSLRVLSLD